MSLPLAFLTPSPMTMLVLGVLAVLLFGKRLPEVGRNVGRGLMEFKKGLRSIQDELENATRTAVNQSSIHPSSSSSTSTYAGAIGNADDREEATAPKFEPPPEETKPQSAQA